MFIGSFWQSFKRFSYSFSLDWTHAGFFMTPAWFEFRRLPNLPVSEACLLRPKRWFDEREMKYLLPLSPPL